VFFLVRIKRDSIIDFIDAQGMAIYTIFVETREQDAISRNTYVRLKTDEIPKLELFFEKAVGEPKGVSEPQDVSEPQAVSEPEIVIERNGGAGAGGVSLDIHTYMYLTIRNFFTWRSKDAANPVVENPVDADSASANPVEANLVEANAVEAYPADLSDLIRCIRDFFSTANLIAMSYHHGEHLAIEVLRRVKIVDVSQILFVFIIYPVLLLF
jgi:hypothetical protein